MFDCEKNGEKFRLKTYLEAREICHKVTEEIIAQIIPGMNEEEGQLLVKEVFKKYGITHFWHPTKFRIGTNTTKTFRDISNPETCCETGDLCFVDLGPIINEHEADFGRTFVVGGALTARDSDFVKLINASESVFLSAAEAWKSKGLTGLELLQFADQKCRELGYKINPLMAGHRLGDFPHHVHSKQKLFEFEGTPTENLWVLEIHVINENTQRGAFFEDILV